MALTDVKIKAVKVPKGKKQGKLADSGGLYLLVKASGKYWRLDYRFGDKRKTMAIGVYPQVSLKEARDKRESAKKLLEKNIDPSQSKRADRRKAIMKSNEAKYMLDYPMTGEPLLRKRNSPSDSLRFTQLTSRPISRTIAL